MIFNPQPVQRLVHTYQNGRQYYYMSHNPTKIYIDKLKLKYIVQNDNKEYKYIEKSIFY